MTTTPLPAFPGSSGPSRRGLLGSALAVGAAVPLGVVGRASAATQAAPAPAGPADAAATPGAAATRKSATTATPPIITLPTPTGPHRVGVVDLRLVDRDRPDPIAGPGHFRELMVSLWYPARAAGPDRCPPAPWLPDGVYAPYLAELGFDATAFECPLTSGHTGAPVLRPERRLPVVLYAHGAHSHRADNTNVVQELASHGYLVVTIGFTYDTWVRFPDGRILSPSHTPMNAVDNAADARSVLNALAALAAGHNPDADGKQLPDGLAGAPDLDRVGMFGWSKGGTAVAYTMLSDDRVRAGLAFDGTMAPTINADLDRPFMMITAAFPRAGDPDVAGFWSHLKGWRLNIHPEGAVHSSFNDGESLIPQIAPIIGMSEQDRESFVGTLDTDEGVHLQQAYPVAFFDKHLRHRRARLLDGPSPAFPDVTFVP